MIVTWKDNLKGVCLGTAALCVYALPGLWALGLLTTAVVPEIHWPSFVPIPELANSSPDMRLFCAAFSSGALGAITRFALRASSQPNLHMLKIFPVFAMYHFTAFAGAVIGLLAYFLLRSHALIKLLYAGELPAVELNTYGVAVVSGLAGLLALELVGHLTQRFPTMRTTIEETSDGVARTKNRGE